MKVMRRSDLSESLGSRVVVTFLEMHPQAAGEISTAATGARVGAAPRMVSRSGVGKTVRERVTVELSCRPRLTARAGATAADHGPTRGAAREGRTSREDRHHGWPTSHKKSEDEIYVSPRVRMPGAAALSDQEMTWSIQHGAILTTSSVVHLFLLEILPPLQ